jgi:hypothetical protein
MIAFDLPFRSDNRDLPLNFVMAKVHPDNKSARRRRPVQRLARRRDES